LLPVAHLLLTVSYFQEGDFKRRLLGLAEGETMFPIVATVFALSLGLLSLVLVVFLPRKPKEKVARSEGKRNVFKSPFRRTG
jgi:hypothetical protein